MENIQEYLKDITDKELRAELNRRNKINKVYAKDRERCRTCKHCVNATTLAKMIKNKEVDSAEPFYCYGHYCLIKKDLYDRNINYSIGNWTKNKCELYKKK